MSDYEKALRQFKEANLAFPKIPHALVEDFEEHSPWTYASIKDFDWPYELKAYLPLLDYEKVMDFAILSHTGHGSSSYAVHYYLFYKNLRMLLQMNWGGVYTNEKTAMFEIGKSVIISKVILRQIDDGNSKLGDKTLTIVGSDFWGSCWGVTGEKKRPGLDDSITPSTVLNEVWDWMNPY